MLVKGHVLMFSSVMIVFLLRFIDQQIELLYIAIRAVSYFIAFTISREMLQRMGCNIIGRLQLSLTKTWSHIARK